MLAVMLLSNNFSFKFIYYSTVVLFASLSLLTESVPADTSIDIDTSPGHYYSEQFARVFETAF